METTWPDSGGRDENLARRSLGSTILAFARIMPKNAGRGHALLHETFKITSLPRFAGSDDHNDASDVDFCNPRSPAPAPRNRRIPGLRPDLYHNLD